MPVAYLRNVQPMIDGEKFVWVRDGRLATILFDRPQARNAVTWHMYEGLAAACERGHGDNDIRVAVLRGVSSRALVIGLRIFLSSQGIHYAEHGLEIYTRQK